MGLVLIIIILSLIIIFLCILLYKARKIIINLRNSLAIQDAANENLLELTNKILKEVESIKGRI
jgi:predicted Holliday junction resolvase-like endonuclease